MFGRCIKDLVCPDCKGVVPFCFCERTRALEEDRAPFLGFLVGFAAASSDAGSVSTAEYSALRLYDVMRAERAASEAA